jgi:hypothetical protein
VTRGRKMESVSCTRNSSCRIISRGLSRENDTEKKTTKRQTRIKRLYRH